jgi:protoheme ferro-lyase
LKEQNTSLVFQSRLGRTPWLEPDLVDVLPQLAAQGVKRPAVFCPAFVADCLETIEEVGIRARAQWKELGGEDLCLVPCVNANPIWVDGVISMIRETVDVEGRRGTSRDVEGRRGTVVSDVNHLTDAGKRAPITAREPLK